MYLKNLDLYGFKSFAERTELQFVPGVTAVVGPNGSGKSNVSDAVRWVLGEQSAKSLRGAKMQDIIFSGSDSRKAVNFAEVGLTLDNSDRTLNIDYAEVTVTRRLYRSGESEFLLNNQSCRLKDIASLFMDTGMGKEAYSIIGQGRVEEILSSKSEDRRAILDEAAGVMKYRSRKKDATRKLEETEDNLVRLQDIKHEVEAQLDPLRKQAEKAKRYQVLASELKEKEISVCVYQIEDLHRRWQESLRRAENYKAEREECTAEIVRLEAEEKQKKARLKQLEAELDQLQRNLLSVTEEAEKLEGQKEVLKERKKNFSTNKQDMTEKLDTLQERIQQFKDEKEKERFTKERLTGQITDLQKQIDEQEVFLEHHTQQVDDRLEDLKTDYIDRLNEQAALKHECKNLEQVLQQAAYKEEQLQARHEDSIAARKSLEERLKTEEDALSGLMKELEVCREQYDQKQSEYETLSTYIEQRTETYRERQSVYEQKRARRAFLQEMKEDFSGFHHGVKAVLKAGRGTLQGIVGAVAELITVPKELETAIETALGPAMQHIVVSDEASARAAIGYLKKSRAGRATFLPLNVMQPRRVSSQHMSVLEEHKDFIGFAADIISFEDRYRPVLQYLLGSVVITRSLKAANELSRTTGYRLRFVTLDGDIVNPGGAMTGGAQNKNKTNLLGREREIEQLTSTLQQEQTFLEREGGALQNDKLRLAGLQTEIEHIRRQGEQAQERVQTYKESLAELRSEKKNTDEKLQLYDQEMLVLTDDRKVAEQQYVHVQQRISELDAHVRRMEDDMKELERRKKEKESSKDEKNAQLTELKMELAQKQQQLTGSNAQLARLEKEHRQTEQERDALAGHIAVLEGRLGSQGDQEQQLDEKIADHQRQRSLWAEQLESLRKERVHTQDEVRETEYQVKEWRQKQKWTAEKAHKEEVQSNRLDVELEHVITLLREEYELSYELAKEQYSLPADYEKAKREVSALKTSIEQLGNVHLDAIEEYDRLVERHDFLQRQEQDLLQAKDTLCQVIEEMDSEMTKRFQDTFEQIRRHFLGVFQELFGGGRADLVLSDPDDMLVTGVDIVAQPPGKKLQHLGLLSGGERALTAIALLFAILKVRPVPFCVLDEVEAALDEANVSRFAQYLTEFSAETQFIVITHRKGTMEEADALYGITMQESGVSNIVSVKMEETEDMVSV